MALIAYVLILVFAGITVFNCWMYQKNVAYEFHDEMGAPINFNFGYGLSMIPLAAAAVIHPSVPWWVSLVILSTVLYIPFVFRRVLHAALRRLNLADRPRPQTPPRRLP